MNLVLTGYRASGKTTLGCRIAEKLGWPFVDTDELVRKHFDNLTIAEIWEQHGEPAFRQAECDVVADLVQKDGHVIALGGGTLMQPAARRTLAEAAGTVCIYLKADAPVLAGRIAADDKTRTERPNLTGLGGGVAEVEAVLAEREAVYEGAADHVLDTNGLAVDQVDQAADQIIALAGAA